jgi:hypothetical protein
MLLLLAVVLALAGCQASGDPEKYMRTHEPKTGGPDL